MSKKTLLLQDHAAPRMIKIEATLAAFLLQSCCNLVAMQNELFCVHALP